jgi:uncharacterized membrane protein
MKRSDTRLNFRLLTTTLTGFALVSLTGGAALAANWTITDLGALGPPGNAIYESRAYNINSAGQVAGKGVVLIDGVLQNHYVRWSNDTQIDLGIRTNSSGVDAAPINNAGQGCGWFMVGPTTVGKSHALCWQGGVGTPLPEFPSHGGSAAVALNIHGHAVASAYRAAYDAPAVLWHNGTMTSLSDLPEVQAAGWAWLTVRDSDDHDQIVGIGSRGGLVRAFLLSPVPMPSLISGSPSSIAEPTSQCRFRRKRASATSFKAPPTSRLALGSP